MNTIKMFWSMLSGLLHMKNFENKEVFWEWYWGQIPDENYPGETLYEAWDTFKWIITFGSIRDDIEMWFKRRFIKKHFGYSWTFGKNGYFFKHKNCWWFVPGDNSFTYGVPCYRTEWENKNPLFMKK